MLRAMQSTAVQRPLRFYQAKLTFPDLKRQVVEKATKWNTTVLLIEDAASGQQLIQVLRNEAPRSVLRPIPCKPVGDKVIRFSGQSHRIEAGELILCKPGPLIGEFERELLGFPNLKHDDQVDALTQLLAWHTGRQKQTVVPTGDSPLRSQLIEP